MDIEWLERIRGGFYAAATVAMVLRLLAKDRIKFSELEKELRELKEDLEVLGINSTLTGLIDYILSEAEETVVHPEWTIDSKVWSKIKDRLGYISSLILKELEEKTIVVFKPKGRLNYAELVEKGLTLLISDKTLLNKLPSIVKHDLEEALFCLCFERPTASAMVALRAVEAALRQLHATLKPEARIERIYWSTILEDLEKLFKQHSIEAKTLLGYLDHLRNVRNEAEHPDKIFNQIEAEDVLINACYAVREVYKIIDELKERVGKNVKKVSN